jgi:phage tail sheath gpL-like
VPGLWLTVALLAAAASPGSQTLRACMIAPKATGQGDMVADTELRAMGGADDVKSATGGGSLAHLCYKALFANCPTALVDLVCPVESAGAAATRNITFAGTLTKNVTVEANVHGRVIQWPWNVGETADVCKATGITAIGQYADDLHVLASSGGAGILTFTAKTKGPSGNDVAVRVRILDAGSGGTVNAAQSTGVVKLSGGTTEIDITNALTTISGTEYDYIVLCCSSADAENAAGTSNPARAVAYIVSQNTGLNAKLQQLIVCSNNSIAAAATAAVARNSEVLEFLNAPGAMSLPCEFSGAECGDRIDRVSLNPNPNRIGTQLAGLYGSLDPVGDNPTTPEIITSLNAGVTPFGYAPVTNALTLIRPITTHSKDTGGNLDRRVFDSNAVDAMYQYAKDLRAALPQEFFQVKIMRDRVAGDEELPEGVVEERDVKAFLITRTTSFWVPKGVVDGEKFNAAVTAGKLTVKVNASDETQVDIFIPAEPFNVLAKFGLYIAKAS